MRKLWYVGAVMAGGIVLFGVSPAFADDQPGTSAPAAQTQPAGDFLSGGVGPGNAAPTGPAANDTSGLPAGGVAVLDPATSTSTPAPTVSTSATPAPDASNPSAATPSVASSSATDPSAATPSATDPSATTPSATTPSAAVSDAASPDASADPADPRLNEEPIDGDSQGAPAAGQDLSNN